MSSVNPESRRRFLRTGLLVGGLGVLPVAALAGCGEAQVIEVVKEVPVEKIKEVVKEVPVEREKVVTRVVEKIVERIVTVEAMKPKPEQVVLRHMFFHSQWTKSFEAIHNNFQEKNPHVTVIFEAPAGGGYGRKIGVMLAGGVAPDVFSINWDMVQIFGQREQLFDLTEVAKVDKQFSADLDAYHPKIAKRMKFKGHQLGVGLDHDNVGVFWNVSMFEEMGVPAFDRHPRRLDLGRCRRDSQKADEAGRQANTAGTRNERTARPAIGASYGLTVSRKFTRTTTQKQTRSWIPGRFKPFSGWAICGTFTRWRLRRNLCRVLTLHSSETCSPPESWAWVPMAAGAPTRM